MIFKALQPEPSEPSQPTPPQLPQPAMPEEQPEAQASPPAAEVIIPQNAFLIMAGTQAIPLDKALITIGRSHDNTIVLDDPRVSRKHLEIRVVRDHFVLFDLNSSGGTYVNRQKVTQGILYSGDVVSLAGVTFVFTQDSSLRSPGTDPLSAQSAGDRHTAIFNSSLDALNKKKKGWW
ncbi:MAG: FHA domain-containing protein [Anaerolineales bacterium]|nr:FHA domain-containing protein [Anaerolineales bacterium]